MLIKILVNNFLSFDKETELTMIPSNKTRKIPDHKISANGLDILKYASIYGANAAGKSNLIEVFNFVKYCITNALPSPAVEMFCKSKKENKEKESVFEFQFIIDNKFYAYGFSALLSKRKYNKEWLYELYKNGSSKTMFEWEYGKKPEVGLNLDSNDSNKLSTYIDDFDENAKTLFLTFMNKDKKLSQDSNLLFFNDIYSWFIENLVVCTPHTSITSFEYYYDSASLSKINELINIFDTGITNVKIEEINMDEFKNELPKPIFEDVLNDINEKIEKSKESNINLSMRSNSSFFNIMVTNGKWKITTLKFTHGKSFYSFKFKEESDGTRRLFELLDMLLNKGNMVYVVDEIERSLHPKLISEFIKLFNKLHKTQNIQLIFTTHEASIMDQELFRRDEIWFVERDNNNCSNVYSLDKFKERYDKKLSKAYLEGRYGAIPVFLSFEFKGE